MTDHLLPAKGAGELVPAPPPPERQAFRSAALASLRSAALLLDEQVQAMVAEGDVQRLAEGGQDLQAFIGDLHSVMDDVRRGLGAAVDKAHDARLLAAYEEKREAWRTKCAEIPCRVCKAPFSEHHGDNAWCPAPAETKFVAKRKFPKPPAEPKLKPTGTKKAEVEGVGLIEVNGGTTRKNWRSEDLVRELLEVALKDLRIFDADTGEDAHEAAYDRLMEVLGTCLPLTGSLNWRVGRYGKDDTPATGLRAYGFDADDEDQAWCEGEAKPRLATIPKLDGTVR